MTIKIQSQSKEKIKSDQILCTIHDDWAGLPNKVAVCKECIAKAEHDLDHLYYEGQSLRQIRDRQIP